MEKVRALRSGYIASCGLVVPRVDHALRILDFAQRDGRRPSSGSAPSTAASSSLRVGIDTGSVTSGLVGGAAVYDMWGDSVNLAYRVQAVEPASPASTSPRRLLRPGARRGHVRARPARCTTKAGEQAVWRLEVGAACLTCSAQDWFGWAVLVVIGLPRGHHRADRGRTPGWSAAAARWPARCTLLRALHPAAGRPAGAAHPDPERRRSRNEGGLGQDHRDRASGCWCSSSCCPGSTRRCSSTPPRRRGAAGCRRSSSTSPASSSSAPGWRCCFSVVWGADVGGLFAALGRDLDRPRPRPAERARLDRRRSAAAVRAALPAGGLDRVQQRRAAGSSG